MTLRGFYDDRLDAIRTEVVRMGNIASEMTRKAVESVIHGDTQLAMEVIETDDVVDDIEQKTLLDTSVLIMQEAPVATELRFLTSTLGVVGEIEKVADDAVKLARRSSKMAGSFPGEMRASLAAMDKNARHAFTQALRLYAEFTPQLADEVIRSDKAIDTEYTVARSKLFELIQSNPEATEQLVRTIEIFHALEHVADRAVAIAKRMRSHYGAPDAGARAS